MRRGNYSLCQGVGDKDREFSSLARARTGRGVPTLARYHLYSITSTTHSRQILVEDVLQSNLVLIQAYAFQLQ